MAYDTLELEIDALGRRPRTVRILSPDLDRTSPTGGFPVLYMPDGQNLFRDAEASYGKSWDFPAALAGLGHGLIVVGWDSAEDLQRLDELGPWRNDWIQQKAPGITRPVGGEGQGTLDFVVNQLKPLVDSRYPTLPGRATTWVAGSSMGGLFALYAAASRPDVFSRAGCFSSAFWIAGAQLDRFVASSAASKLDRVYLDVGTMEGSRQNNEEERQAYVNDTKRIGALLSSGGLGPDRLKVVLDEGGTHNEAAWSRRLPAALKWLAG
ncbi:MAG: alpha/beta hydrolase-fold protein [Spirochaetales bacterium]